MWVVIWVTMMVAIIRDEHPNLEAGSGVWCFG